MKYTPMRCMLVRRMPMTHAHDIHAYKVHAHVVYAHEVHAYEM
jgi:hypothetical protein